MGWRYWQLSRAGRLRSVTQKWIEWPVGAPLVASCLEVGHPAPAERCNCGIHASADLETLRQHGLCLVPDVGVVVGRVTLGGRVLDDGGGWRAERAKPATLSVVVETVAPAALGDVMEGLGAYGVAVDTVGLDQAVAGASAAMLAFQAMSARASASWDEGPATRP